MPPRIRPANTLPGRFVTLNTSRPVLPFLAPAIQFNSPAPLQRTSDTRFASILSSLRANPGEHHKAIKRGRGPSSGKGKTSGRGHKGQKQHGKVPFGFEGGQTPLIVVKGKRGFVNVHSENYNIVPLSRIRSWVAQGRLDPTKPITVRELAISGCVNDIKDGVKLLANSKSHDVSIDELPPLTQPLTIVVSRASKQAIEAVEQAGGRVLTRYYTHWAIKKIIEGKMDPMNSLLSIGPDGVTPAEKQAESLTTDQPVDVASGATGATDAPIAPWATPALPTTNYAYRLPDATSRKAMEYYRDPAKRGYLSYQVKEGQNPSLFFKDIAHESNFGKFAKGAKNKSKKDEHAKMF